MLLYDKRSVNWRSVLTEQSVSGFYTRMIFVAGSFSETDGGENLKHDIVDITLVHNYFW
jgi:hypothetical protein